MSLAPRSSSAAGAASGNVTVAKPAGVVDGDLLVAFQFAAITTAAGDLVPPAGWTSLSPTGGTASAGRGKLSWKVASSEGSSYVFGANASFSSITIIVAVPGTDPSTPIDVACEFSSSVTSSTSFTETPGVTTVTDGCLLLCGYSSGSNITFTPPAGETELQDLNSGGVESAMVAWELLGAAGATGTRTATGSAASTAKLSAMVAIRPAPVAVAAALPRRPGPNFRR